MKRLWQYYIYEPITNDAGIIVDFTAYDNSEWFKFKQSQTRQKNDGGIKDVELMVPLKCLRNFLTILEMLQIFLNHFFNF